MFYSDALIESGVPIKVKADLCAAKLLLVATGFMQMHRWIQASDFAKIYQRIAASRAKTSQPFLSRRSLRTNQKAGLSARLEVA
ncbi:hypothetical protein [Neorhizobium sp. T7_12]|uniref:hypothetical protein n=1 Tax=Neorhizobium sp. T7_12 TaxID=2093832 RepID=UPI00155E5531|nr:hypothetical protein [Neorhizobium sp. T7_12]